MSRFKYITEIQVEKLQEKRIWHEGVSEKEARRFIKVGYNHMIFTKYYWKRAKSYVFIDRLSNHATCITKEYLKELKNEQN